MIRTLFKLSHMTSVYFTDQPFQDPHEGIVLGPPIGWRMTWHSASMCRQILPFPGMSLTSTSSPRICAVPLTSRGVLPVVAPAISRLLVPSCALSQALRRPLRRIALTLHERPFVPSSEQLRPPPALASSSTVPVPALAQAAPTPTPVPTVVAPIPPCGVFANSVPTSIATPVHVTRLSSTHMHPSPSIIYYVLHGFRHSFDIGFTGPLSSTRPYILRSALDDVPGVTAAIHRELRRRHVAGPFLFLPFPILHCSPLGAALWFSSPNHGPLLSPW